MATDGAPLDPGSRVIPLRVPPGPMGLLFQFAKEGPSAPVVANVAANCPFRSKVMKGDRLLSLAGLAVTNPAQLSFRKEQERELVFLRPEVIEPGRDATSERKEKGPGASFGSAPAAAKSETKKDEPSSKRDQIEKWARLRFASPTTPNNATEEQHKKETDAEADGAVNNPMPNLTSSESLAEWNRIHSADAGPSYDFFKRGLEHRGDGNAKIPKKHPERRPPPSRGAKRAGSPGTKRESKKSKCDKKGRAAKMAKTSTEEKEGLKQKKSAYMRMSARERAEISRQNNERTRNKLAQMTPEEREEWKQKKREYNRAYSAEYRQKKSAYMQMLARERAEISRKNDERMRNKLAHMTPAEREESIRKKRDYNYNRRYRAENRQKKSAYMQMSPEERAEFTEREEYKRKKSAHMMYLITIWQKTLESRDKRSCTN